MISDNAISLSVLSTIRRQKLVVYTKIWFPCKKLDFEILIDGSRPSEVLVVDMTFIYFYHLKHLEEAHCRNSCQVRRWHTTRCFIDAFTRICRTKKKSFTMSRGEPLNSFLWLIFSPKSKRQLHHCQNSASYGLLTPRLAQSQKDTKRFRDSESSAQPSELWTLVLYVSEKFPIAGMQTLHMLG